MSPMIWGSGQGDDGLSGPLSTRGPVAIRLISESSAFRGWMDDLNLVVAHIASALLFIRLPALDESVSGTVLTATNARSPKRNRDVILNGAMETLTAMCRVNRSFSMLVVRWVRQYGAVGP